MTDLPTWDQFMTPVLQFLAGTGPTMRRDIYDQVAQSVGLTEKQRSALLPSGQFTYKNRIGWALSDLTKARLLSRPARGTYEITESGRRMLGHPASLTKSGLHSIPGYEESSKVDSPPTSPARSTEMVEFSLDPVEQVEDGIERINEQVRAELLDRLTTQKPMFFEQVVVDLIVAMGYGGQDTKAVRTQLSNDAGIDGVIDQDVLGLSSVYVQAKLYALDRSVQRPEVQAFVGALHGKHTDHGVFITTGRFSPGAKNYVHNIQDRVVLIDGVRLSALMIRYGIGVYTVRTLSIVKMDEDFFG